MKKNKEPEFWVFPLSQDKETEIKLPGKAVFTLRQGLKDPFLARKVPKEIFDVIQDKRRHIPWRQATEKEIKKAKQLKGGSN